MRFYFLGDIVSSLLVGTDAKEVEKVGRSILRTLRWGLVALVIGVLTGGIALLANALQVAELTGFLKSIGLR